MSNRLCAKPMVGTAPRPRRSSGHKVQAQSTRRWAGPYAPRSGLRPGRWPHRLMVWSSPDKCVQQLASAHCPDTPAVCFHLARLDLKLHINEVHAKLVGAQRQVLHPQHPWHRLAPGGAPAPDGSAPIIRRDREALVSSAGLHPVTLPPPARCKQCTAREFRCNLWLM